MDGFYILIFFVIFVFGILAYICIFVGEKKENFADYHIANNEFLYLYNAGKWTEAIQYFEKNIKIDLNCIDLGIDYDKIAYCYLRTGRYEQSIQLYSEELKNYPNSKKSFYNRAIAKYKLNSNDTKDLEEIYNKEQPFILLDKKTNLQFDDNEKKTAQKIKKDCNYIEIGNIFGTYNKIR